jgi:predicted RNA-binding Zn ribbon-like protein
LIGGWMCLDFANTVSTRDEALYRLHREYLTSYDQLVAWSQHAGLLAENEAKAMLQTAADHPALAAAALDRAIALREAIYGIFSAIAHDREPAGGDLAAMNSALHEALSRQEVVRSDGRFRWTWVLDGDDLDRILWPIVRSAADLLTSEDLGRVRECAREGCDWLFVDMSKNQSRRWCTMSACGSRVKARRYYHRKKGSGRTRQAPTTHLV